MIEGYATARSMGATDQAIEAWLDRSDLAIGEAPRARIAADRAHETIEMMEAAAESAFT